MVFRPTEEQKKTIDYAESVLQRYKWHLHHSRQEPSIGSPKYDGMPKAPSHGNSQEDDIIDHLVDPNRQYCDYCQEIVKAINDEESELFAQFIKRLYFGWQTPADVRSKYNLGHHPYYDTLNKAKLAFGESCSKKKIERFEHESRRIQY